MTAVVAIVQDSKIYFGADSAGSDGNSLQSRSDAKVFVNGECGFGFTSSFRMGQLLQYVFSPPQRVEDCTAMKYMVWQFIPAVKSVLKSNGFEASVDGVESGGTFLVGYHGELFEIASDYQVGQRLEAYAAIGSGRDIALGNLHATEQFDLTPKQRIDMALTAASEFNCHVRPPFNHITI